jgi:hypothetical protein
MSDKNCLTCKYEPEWGEWTSGTYSRCSGECRWDGVIPSLPAAMYVSVSRVVRYSDDSGIERKCATWEGKADQQPTTQQGEE